MIWASAVPLAWLQAMPRDGQDVAAIFPPWVESGDAVARAASAGGAVVRLGALDSIVVVHGETSEIGTRLHAAGAWFVVDPVAFGGCLTRRS